MMSFEETFVVGSWGDGGTKGEPKRRSTVPSLYMRIAAGRISVAISLVGVEAMGMDCIAMEDSEKEKK